MIEVRDAEYNHLNNFEDNFGSDEYDEEKAYMCEVSQSLGNIGKWAISVQCPPGSDQDPFKTPEIRQLYDQIFDFLVSKAISVLDTDCMNVGWPMIDFLTPWVQSHYKMTE